MSLTKEQLIAEIESDVWNAEGIADLILLIRRLEKELAAAKADTEHWQKAYVALAERSPDKPSDGSWLDANGKRHAYRCGLNPDPNAMKHLVAHCTCEPPADPGNEWMPDCTCGREPKFFRHDSQCPLRYWHELRALNRKAP